MSILYRSDAPRAAAWASYFAQHAPDLEQVEYLIAWQVPPDFLAQLPRTEGGARLEAAGGAPGFGAQRRRDGAGQLGCAVLERLASYGFRLRG